MKRTLRKTIPEVKREIKELAALLDKDKDKNSGTAVVEVQSDPKLPPIAAILPWDLYEALNHIVEQLAESNVDVCNTLEEAVDRVSSWAGADIMDSRDLARLKLITLCHVKKYEMDPAERRVREERRKKKAGRK